MASMKVYTPCEHLNSTSSLRKRNYGVLILNTPFHLEEDKFGIIWNNAKIRVIVDGGAATWVSWKQKLSTVESELCLPQLVTGDFDSISPEILEEFKHNDAVDVICTPDQNDTDFTKALIEFSNYQKKQDIQIEYIYVLMTIGGRMDQMLANINTLYYGQHILPNASIFLLCPDSISWLLAPGSHTISIPLLSPDNKKCGLIPIGSPAVVTTSGLKWNLNKRQIKFGEVVSSSNTYDGSSPEVHIETDSNILWTMSI